MGFELYNIKYPCTCALSGMAFSVDKLRCMTAKCVKVKNSAQRLLYGHVEPTLRFVPFGGRLGLGKVSLAAKLTSSTAKAELITQPLVTPRNGACFWLTLSRIWCLWSHVGSCGRWAKAYKITIAVVWLFHRWENAVLLGCYQD